MRTLLLAFAIITTPAQASVWTSEDCKLTVETIDGHFVIFTERAGDERDGVTCKVENWPISSANAQLACDDGSTPQMSMETADGPIVFDSERLAVWRQGMCD